ncbi:hypothetical protein CMK18_17585 [Candidatus Poribacteria bacterium]|nr:hypothetical protein [Candidatus Poribacteria bacterium]
MKKEEIEFYDDEIDLFEYVSLFWRRKWLIISITLICCSLAVFYALYMAEEKFESKTTLMPLKSSTGGGLSSLRSMIPAGLGVNLPMGQSETDVNRFINILNSRTITEVVAKELKLIDQLYPSLSEEEKSLPQTYEQMIRSMQNELVSIGDNKKGLLVISCNTTSASLSADIANTYVKHLKNYLAENTATESQRNRIFIEKQYRKSTETLAKIDKELQEFKEQNSIFSIEAQSEGLVNRIGLLEGTLSAKEIELAVLDNVNVARNNPKRRSLGYEVEALKNKLKSIRSGSDTSGHSMSVNLNEIPKIERELKNLMREQVKQETLYALLAQQYEQVKIQEASDEISITVLDPAIPAVTRSKPNRKLLVLMGGVIGLMLSIGLVITLNIIEQYKHDPSDENT